MSILFQIPRFVLHKMGTPNKVSYWKKSIQHSELSPHVFFTVDTHKKRMAAYNARTKKKKLTMAASSDIPPSQSQYQPKPDKRKTTRNRNNEIVTTYDISCEVLKCYSWLVLNEKQSHAELGFWDWQHHVIWHESMHPLEWIYDRLMCPCNITTLWTWIERGTESVEQQEHDGESTNLVHGENNNVQQNNDTWRGWEDKRDEEQNVRPQRESPWDHFCI